MKDYQTVPLITKSIHYNVVSRATKTTCQFTRSTLGSKFGTALSSSDCRSRSVDIKVSCATLQSLLEDKPGNRRLDHVSIFAYDIGAFSYRTFDRASKTNSFVKHTFFKPNSNFRDRQDSSLSQITILEQIHEAHA